MANNTSTFGQLPDGNPPVNSDIFVIQRADGLNYRFTAAEFSTFIGAISGITSINGDITTAQVIAAGIGLGLVDAGATHTFSIDATVATLTGVQILTNKTLTTPTIASFVNSTHTHLNAAGGGTLTATAITDFDTEVTNNAAVLLNTAKITNANHTGDVTGATVLTIAVGAVDIAMLSATGTPDATNFLRGDNTWAVPAGLAGVTSINADTTAAQLLAGTASRISLVDAAALHTFDIDAAYVGQASITTLGTITTGVWNGTAIALANIVNGTANQIIKTNTGGTALEFGLIGDANIAVHTSTKITITAKGQLNSAIVYNDQANTYTGGGTQNFGGASFTNFIANSFTNDISADEVHVEVRNESGGTINKGDAVVVSGYSIGQDLPLVILADASAEATMPAFGIVESASVLNNANGDILISGRIEGFDTSGFAAGDVLYISNVGTTTNTLTNVKPTGTDLIEAIGEVLRSHASLGVLEVETSGVVNDLPNVGVHDLSMGGNNLTNVVIVTPTIASFVNSTHDHADAAGGGQLLSTAALSDTANIAYLNTANVYTAGTRQDFLGLLAGTAGINVGAIAGNPTSQVNGDIWYNSTSNTLFGRINGVNVDLGVTAGGGDMVLADVQTVTGAKTFGTIGGAVGKFILAGSTSGSTIVNAAAVAGTTTLTLQGVTGTVALLGDKLDAFAATTSAELASVISNETGTGLLVFGTSPTIVTPVIASFISATHDHSNAAGGGNLTNTALTSGTFAAITGLGTQAIALAMGTNLITGIKGTQFVQETVTYNATQIFDLDDNQYQQITLTGVLSTLTTSNRAAAKMKTIIIVGDSVDRLLTFNTSWKTNPSDATVTVTANTSGVLSLYCRGTAETDVWAVYVEFS